MTFEDSQFRTQVERLHRLTVWGRWLVVLFLWLTLGTLSLWSLRYSIQLWFDYFTWSAVRYGLAYHRLAAIGLGICFGMTLAVLSWQSRNILFGLPPKEQHRLVALAMQIRNQGARHPLWKWVCREEQGRHRIGHRQNNHQKYRQGD
ncbi:hypothetical protein GS597_18660 [Synechococcales cyanobacterium C]|uniref:Uncharacterized protein n=1 Tax=Petrachloros mirabilis ULC683 TaxID=2781853 RepID=A0A8K2A2L8_9CYAN|nr:hypothetical protein [Petrachloros mirabilis]NCJ08492.1 hypothetical protein [Petrachloros mirabilis ULC683]